MFFVYLVVMYECGGGLDGGQVKARDSAYCIHSYRENLIKATLPLSYITSGKEIWILHSASSFKHSASDLLGGTMEEADEGWGACIDFFSFLFRRNASHPPPHPLLLNTFPSLSAVINLSILAV